jgi:hypothetical protein
VGYCFLGDRHGRQSLCHRSVFEREAHVSKHALSGPYAILPGLRDADRREESEREARFIDFIRGYACGAITMITFFTAALLAVRWLA